MHLARWQKVKSSSSQRPERGGICSDCSKFWGQLFRGGGYLGEFKRTRAFLWGDCCPPPSWTSPLRIETLSPMPSLSHILDGYPPSWACPTPRAPRANLDGKQKRKRNNYQLRNVRSIHSRTVEEDAPSHTRRFVALSEMPPTQYS